MKTLLNASILVLAVLLVGCSSGSDSGGGQPGVDAGNNASDGGGSTNNSPGNTGGGADTGGTDSGSNTGGGTDSGGSTNDGGSGGGSGGGSDPGTAFATLANLYTAQNVRLNFNNCNVLANGSVNFAQAVFRLIAQSGDQVSAVISLTPDSQFLSLFDQTVINLTGNFTSENTVEGSFSALSTLNGTVVDRAQSSFTLTVVLGTTLIINLDPDSDPQACHISGGFDLAETSDPGTGGSSGGGSGGGSGGSSGGNTGGGSTGGLIIATGRFGSLQMQSLEFPDDNGTFEMTTVQFVNIPGNEMFAWTNAQQVTANFYFGLDNDNTTLNTMNSRTYSCDCFPAVDLINNQVVFSNLVLTKRTIPAGSITLNGTLTFPQASQ